MIFPDLTALRFAAVGAGEVDDAIRVPHAFATGKGGGTIGGTPITQEVGF